MRDLMITGASGGVGSFAVQIAKYFGAELTGLCSTEKVDLVKSIGADHVIDYKKDDFTKSDLRFDLILNNTGNLRPAVDKVFTFQKIPDAIKYLEGEFARGKIVISMDSERA